MKKIMILIALMVGVMTGANAQQVFTMPLKAGDSVVNSGTASKYFKITGGYSGVVITPKVTKYSGTAGGTAVLYESIDGVNYTSTTDSFVLNTSTTQVKNFHKTAPLNQYYKVILYGTGTVGEILSLQYQPTLYQTK